MEINLKSVRKLGEQGWRDNIESKKLSLHAADLGFIFGNPYNTAGYGSKTKQNENRQIK